MKNIVKSCLVTSHLTKVLKDTSGRELFSRFLEEDLGVSDRVINFWVDCENYANMGRCKQRTKLAKNIYKRYLMKNAPEKINFEENIVKEVKNNINDKNNEVKDEVFVAVQRIVFNQMKKENFQQFLESDFYKKLEREINRE